MKLTTSPNWDEMVKATVAGIEAPEPGMAFHEMFSFWRVVLRVTETHVWHLDVSPPCVVPPDGKLVVDTKERWKKRMYYESMPGRPIELISPRRWNVDGWADVYAENALEEKSR